MRVLTIREPWASLIGCGIKKIETRSWATSYRGELYIHAGVHKLSEKDERAYRLSHHIPGHTMHYGEIFIKCNLVDCVKIDAKYAEKAKEEDPLNYECGNYTLGRYAWILTDIEYITPIPAKGRLSIWNYNENEQC